MKKLVIAAMLMLSACTTTQLLQAAPVIGNVCSAASKTLVDDKAYAAALLIYEPTAYAYLKVVDKLTPATKAKVKPLVQKLYKYVGIIKAGRGTVNCDLASMKALQADILALLPKGQ